MADSRLRSLLTLAFTCAALAPAQNPTATISIDAAANRRAISPNIYGVAHASTATLSDLNVPLNRNGGNNTSRYNWQLNADNRGFDWYFQSIAEPSAVGGERGDTFISNAKAAGAQAMLTIPIIDWVAKVGANRSKLASYSIAKYGPQTGNDWQWFPDAGNGVRSSDNAEITWNDPNDANVPNSSLFQQQWMQHLVTRWGTATNGGLKYYILDNEHSIWHGTHRDVHPAGATMEEIRNKMLDYAARVKAVDPSALVVGPEEWGWSGYIFSGYDQQYGSRNGWSFLPDRANHGNMDYLPWLLNQLKLDGRHLLDIFTVHYYPQGGEVCFCGNDNVTSAMQLRRNRSTRSLWDPAYTDESWIADKVQLVPRLRNWADTYYYAGTPIGITEYNWGAENHINGATAQADIWGIFGREGLDVGARWTTPDAATPTYKAMKMYRNYDGAKSSFGNVSVKATGPNPDSVAVFAAERASDGALTVMVINKYLSGSTPVTLNLANFSAASPAKVYQLTASNTITGPVNLSFSGSTLSTSVPQQSITLFVIPKSQVNNQPPVAVATAAPTSGNAPLPVSFNGSGSSDPDGTITSYAWNFGDATTGSGATPSHTYANAGTYTATLTVTDNAGATASNTVAITVNPDPNVINAPSGLTASAAHRVVTLAWNDNSTNEQGFYIERANSGTTAFAQVGQVAANVKTFSQSVARATYLYRVRAFNLTTGRTSAYSNQVQIRVK